MQRIDPPLQPDEREGLTTFLDYYRATMLRKAEALTSEQAGRQAVPTADLTVAGLLKHMALVEDHWFTSRLSGLDLPEPWLSAPFDDDHDWDFHSAPADDIEDLRALYEESCKRSREAIEGLSLDHLTVKPDEEHRHFSLRWIMLHMIEETARHAGHIDLLREAIDGEVGD